jgi:signal transduction histidine kinase
LFQVSAIMFKATGNLIHRTPWWGMILGGIVMLAVLVLFALPVQVIRLVDSGTTPAENRAIQREIGLEVGGKALDLATGVISALKDRVSTPERQSEFERALAEIERARSELIRAQTEGYDSVIESARDAADSALETAKEAAESAVEAAVEARVAVEEARNDAIERLRGKGIDVSATLKSMEQLIASARENEQAAREALNAMRALQQGGTQAQPGVPAIPPTPAISAKPAIGASTAKPGVSIGVHWPGQRADDRTALVLAPEVRGDIRAKVGSDVWRVAVGSALILAFIPLFLMLLIAKFFIGRSRSALALADRKTREAEISDVSRQVTEARLQTLQAQVEPHFLYNTLANVQALNEVDPPAANQMVGHLIQYLRASLPKMRESTSNVGQELELVRAYLNILQMRMGPRLAFGITAPDDVMACAFPPMMLLSLVENAIKHGLEPQREGGRIDVVVERLLEASGETLRIQVKDTGRGLSDAPLQTGSGLGLSNLRERLAALYGARGRFSLTSNDPKGVVASIEVPLQSSAAYQASQPGHSEPSVHTQAIPATPAAQGWRRVWYATSKTHGLWARLLARVFMVMMVVLAGLLLLGFAALLTGWMPVQMGDLRLDGIESLAVGSVGLLIGFGAAALVVAILVGVLYGLGFVLAAVLVFAVAAMVIGLLPALAPAILIGLAIWWVVKNRRRP